MTKANTWTTALCLLAAVAVPVWGRELTFADRVAAQAAIERVYYEHRTETVRPFRQAVPRSVLEAKVRRYLTQSSALETYWNQPLTAEMLERETRAMARRTRMPERLSELFAALGNDPLLVQECLARAALADRLTSRLVAGDPGIQGDSRRRAERLRRSLVAAAEDGAVAPPSALAETRVLRIERRTAGRVVRAGSATAPPPTRGHALDDAEFERARARLGWPGNVGPLREATDAFFVDVPLTVDGDSLTFLRHRVPKRSREDWLADYMPRDVDRALRGVLPGVARGGATLPRPRDSTDQAFGTADPEDCANGRWSPLIDWQPQAQAFADAVWTGSEMLIWGGRPTSEPSGERYDPVTDAWTPMATAGAPSLRSSASVVWTGTEMIVWGGRSLPTAEPGFALGTGARFDPQTDTWTAMTPIGAPSPRHGHRAVWTGTEMIVWGGTEAGDGARYDPQSDTWTPVSSTNAPQARVRTAAVWTGTEMIVWGGGCFETQSCSSGARYDPQADSWTPVSTTDAPPGELNLTAVWTGAEMIVWGGQVFGGPLLVGGARYDPLADTWSPMSEQGVQPRQSHSTVWTGERMVVWGGESESFADPTAEGQSYDPVGDTWTDLPTTAAPAAREFHTAVWTGQDMIVWGGRGAAGFALNSGARFRPALGTWTATAANVSAAPVSRLSYGTGPSEAVWTGSELFVWTGVSYFGEPRAGRYDPALGAWAPVTTQGEPVLRTFHMLGWTGSEVLLWGGGDPSGGRYDPVSDAWTPMSAVDSPPNLAVQTAVWTGDELIVWASTFTEPIGEGGRYNPQTDTWTPTSLIDAPPGSQGHTAVWTGSEMIVWGGRRAGQANFAPGGRYNPQSDTWLPLSTEDEPERRQLQSAVWTGTEMIVWGGSYRHDPEVDPAARANGGRYNPASDTWLPVTLTDAPSPRDLHRAVWTGSEMIVYGGESWLWETVYGMGPSFADVAIYDPQADRWTAVAPSGAPPGRRWHFADWDGDRLIVWGGGDSSVRHNTGGIYQRFSDADADGVCGTADCNDADPNNWASCATCADGDGDGAFANCDAYVTLSGPDCDDAASEIYPGAGERNDGLDNQCPGDSGFGVVDEVTGPLTLDAALLSWIPQPAATLYEVARSSGPDFTADCVVVEVGQSSFDDGFAPPAAATAYYLIRAKAPSPGSWGTTSTATERSVCN